MTDEELIEALRSIDHMNVDDCFLQSYFYSKAADRIEQLQADVAGWISNAYAASGWASEAEYKLEVAEAKLAKAVAALTSLANMKTAGGMKATSMAWHAREVLAELGGSDD